MHKKLVYCIIITLIFLSAQHSFANEETYVKDCTDPYLLCPSDMLSVKLKSIEVHPGTYDAGGNRNKALELSYYLELGLLSDYRSSLLVWDTKETRPKFPANFDDEPYERTINKKSVDMVGRNIALYNSRENLDIEDFYSKVNLVVKEARTFGKSTLCIVPLAKPGKNENNITAYHQFLSLVDEANNAEDRKAQKQIHIECIANNGSAHLTFKFLFEFERQQLN